MSTAMEVDHRLKGNGSLDVLLGLRGCDLLGGSIETVDVCLVVVLVVKLHNLSRDGGLERTVVVYDSASVIEYIEEAGPILLLTWKIWKSSLAADEACPRQASHSLGSSRSKGSTRSRRGSQEGSRHD